MVHCCRDARERRGQATAPEGGGGASGERHEGTTHHRLRYWPVPSRPEGAGCATMSENETAGTRPRGSRRSRRRQPVRQGQRQDRCDGPRRHHRRYGRAEHRQEPRRNIPDPRRRRRRAGPRHRRRRRGSITWENPDERRRPGARIRDGDPSGHRTAKGETCREFQQTVTIGGREEQSYGTACRDESGDWKLTT